MNLKILKFIRHFIHRSPEKLYRIDDSSSRRQNAIQNIATRVWSFFSNLGVIKQIRKFFSNRTVRRSERESIELSDIKLQYLEQSGQRVGSVAAETLDSIPMSQMNELSIEQKNQIDLFLKEYGFVFTDDLLFEVLLNPESWLMAKLTDFRTKLGIFAKQSLAQQSSQSIEQKLPENASVEEKMVILERLKFGIEKDEVIDFAFIKENMPKLLSNLIDDEKLTTNELQQYFRFVKEKIVHPEFAALKKVLDQVDQSQNWSGKSVDHKLCRLEQIANFLGKNIFFADRLLKVDDTVFDFEKFVMQELKFLLSESPDLFDFDQNQDEVRECQRKRGEYKKELKQTPKKKKKNKQIFGLKKQIITLFLKERLLTLSPQANKFQKWQEILASLYVIFEEKNIEEIQEPVKRQGFPHQQELKELINSVKPTAEKLNGLKRVGSLENSIDGLKREILELEEKVSIEKICESILKPFSDQGISLDLELQDFKEKFHEYQKEYKNYELAQEYAINLDNNYITNLTNQAQKFAEALIDFKKYVAKPTNTQALENAKFRLIPYILIYKNDQEKMPDNDNALIEFAQQLVDQLKREGPALFLTVGNLEEARQRLSELQSDLENHQLFENKKQEIEAQITAKNEELEEICEEKSHLINSLRINLKEYQYKLVAALPSFFQRLEFAEEISDDDIELFKHLLPESCQNQDIDFKMEDVLDLFIVQCCNMHISKLYNIPQSVIDRNFEKPMVRQIIYWAIEVNNWMQY